MGIPLDGVELLHLYRTESADLPQIVAAQINQHVVLCQLLLVREKVGLQCPVLRLVLPSGPGARQRESMKDAVLQLYQSLRRSARHFHVGTGKVEHIRGRVQGPQDTIGVEQTSFERRREPVGQDDLKNISLPNIGLGFLHHGAVCSLIEEGCYLPQQPPAGLTLLRAVPEQVLKTLQFPDRFVVAGFRVTQVHVNYQNDLLPEVVKGDHFVEEHQINVPKLLRVLGLSSGSRLFVSQVIVRKVSYQSSGKGRQSFQPGTFVIVQDLPQIDSRVVGLKCQVSHLHLPVQACDLQLGVKAKEGISPPLLPVLHRFQNIAVAGHIFQLSEDLNRGT